MAVVAGDVHMPLVRALEWLGGRLPGVPFVYVPGNHDFWWDRGEERYSLADQMSRGRDVAARHGIHLLLDDAVTLGDERYLGGMLWTDVRLGSFSLTHAFRSAQGRDGMVDYRRICTGPRSRDRIEPEDVPAMYRATRSFLDAELDQRHDGATVVVTHHAPHPESLPSRYANLAWCAASDLTGLIEQREPDPLGHGHVHRRADCRVGRIPVVCNARGHADENSAFVPGFVLSAMTDR